MKKHLLLRPSDIEFYSLNTNPYQLEFFNFKDKLTIPSHIVYHLKLKLQPEIFFVGETRNIRIRITNILNSKLFHKLLHEPFKLKFKNLRFIGRENNGWTYKVHYKEKELGSIEIYFDKAITPFEPAVAEGRLV